MVIQKKKKKKTKTKKLLKTSEDFGDIFRKGVKDSLQNTVLMCVLVITSQKNRKSFGNVTVGRI